MLHDETLTAEVGPTNSPPLVSVIMPAYNVAPFIAETLDSVFAQTFTDFEVVIVNDGSPDTLELERALAPYLGRVRYIKQENKGAGAARNEGLRAARGELVAFLDADDLWLPGYLSEQVIFIRERGCDLVCADAVHFGQTPLAGRTYMELYMAGGAPTGEVTFLGLVSAEQSLITSGVVARREPVVRVGLFDETLRNSQDFDLWVRLARGGARLAYQRRVLLRYRCHENSLSGDEVNRNLRQLRIYDKIENSFDLTPAERAQLARAISGRRALAEFELGKLYLERGDFERARDSLVRSQKLRPAAKTLAALLLARFAPRLGQNLMRRRHAARTDRPTTGKAHADDRGTINI